MTASQVSCGAQKRMTYDRNF